MGTIYIHAGMAKAGSSSIQRWISDNATWLITELGVQPVVYRPADDLADRVGLRLLPFRGGSVNSTRILDVPPEGRPARISYLVEALAGWAEKGSVLLSSEALAQPIWQPNHAFLAGMAKLGETYRVRVVYYVRPQDTALEAGWRQWGFRTARHPSEYLSSRSRQLHYAKTLNYMATYAPSVEFLMRPFRRDLLAGNDVVRDFVAKALDYESTDYPWHPATENVGLSLRLVNILRAAPPGAFWDNPHDNRRLEHIKDLSAGIDWDAAPHIVRSRLLLKELAHQTFEDGNQAVANALGWSTAFFILNSGDRAFAGSPELAEFDRLWAEDPNSQPVRRILRALQDHLEAAP